MLISLSLSLCVCILGSIPRSASRPPRGEDVRLAHYLQRSCDNKIATVSTCLIVRQFPYLCSGNTKRLLIQT